MSALTPSSLNKGDEIESSDGEVATVINFLKIPILIKMQDGKIIGQDIDTLTEIRNSDGQKRFLKSETLKNWRIITYKS